MKLKTDPSYTTLKYYYLDKTSSDTFLFGDYRNQLLLGSLICTEDGRVYFSASGGGKPILPVSLRDNGIYPQIWMNLSEIEYCIEYQPYDFEEWYKGYSMYSKEFWKLLISHIRDSKIKYIQGQINNNLIWIHSNQ